MKSPPKSRKSDQSRRIFQPSRKKRKNMSVQDLYRSQSCAGMRRALVRCLAARMRADARTCMRAFAGAFAQMCARTLNVRCVASDPATGPVVG